MSDAASILELEERELQWLRDCEQANLEFGARRFVAAGRYWSQAFRSAESFSEDDPRRATSLNNLAVAQRLAGDLEKSARLYRRAKSQWASAVEWVTRMQPRPRARSSTFHLRMESRHRRQYDRPVVERNLNMLGAGLAATRNNLAELAQSSGRSEDAELGYDRALRERTDARLPSDAGLAIIRNNLDGLTARAANVGAQAQNGPSFDATTFSDHAERKGWLIDRPPVFTDEGRLMAALLLTLLLTHDPPAGRA